MNQWINKKMNTQLSAKSRLESRFRCWLLLLPPCGGSTARDKPARGLTHRAWTGTQQDASQSQSLMSRKRWDNLKTQRRKRRTWFSSFNLFLFYMSCIFYKYILLVTTDIVLYCLFLLTFPCYRVSSDTIWPKRSRKLEVVASTI